MFDGSTKETEDWRPNARQGGSHRPASQTGMEVRMEDLLRACWPSRSLAIVPGSAYRGRGYGNNHKGWLFKPLRSQFSTLKLGRPFLDEFAYPLPLLAPNRRGTRRTVTGLWQMAGCQKRESL